MTTWNSILKPMIPMDTGFDSRKMTRYALIALAVVLFFAGLFPVGTVRAGERGVRLRFSAITGAIVGEGLYFKIPLIERVLRIDVKTQKIETKAVAYSKDIQTVDSTIALNYHLNPEGVQRLYQELGIDYRARIIDPAIQESIKAAMA